MANQSDFQKLLTKSATDAKFRDQLLAKPDDAAKSEGVTLSADNKTRLAGAREDLVRFGGNPALHADDAKSWAVGVCLIRRLD